MLGVKAYNNSCNHLVKKENTTPIQHKMFINKEERNNLPSFNGCMIINAIGLNSIRFLGQKDTYIKQGENFADIANNLKGSLAKLLKDNQLNAANVQKAINSTLKNKPYTLNITVKDVSATELAQKLANARCEVTYQPAKTTSEFDKPIINILINFNNPNKSELVGSIVHEFTHALQANREEDLQFRQEIGDKDTLGKLNSSYNILRNVLRKVEFTALTQVFGAPKSPLTLEESIQVIDAMKPHFIGMLDSITNALEPQGLQRDLVLKAYYAFAKDEAQAGHLGLSAEQELQQTKSNILPRKDFYSLVYDALVEQMNNQIN